MSDAPHRPRTRLRWALAIGWVVFIAVIIFCADRRLLQPVFGFIASHPGSDKAGHFLLIGSMAFLLNLALGVREVRCCERGWLLGSFIVGVVFTLEEISQLWLPTRTFDWGDLAGDFAGIFFFGWLAKRVAMRRGQV